MLRFIFKNKDDSIENPARNFWIFALGEFVLVFLGILIALQVDNWNQDRQDRKLEHVLLSELHANLQTDLKDIDYNLSRTSTYESLRSIGIDLIRNASLRQQITYLYSASYEWIDGCESASNTATMDHIYPSMREHLDIWLFDHAVPLDLERMRQSNRFKQDLRINISLMKLSANAYRQAMEKVVRLLEDLEKELGK
jgi:hypothetical protein